MFHAAVMMGHAVDAMDFQLNICIGFFRNHSAGFDLCDVDQGQSPQKNPSAIILRGCKYIECPILI